MKNSWILPIATLAIGAAGGYLSGKGNSAAGTSSAEAELRTHSSSRMGSSAGGDATKKSRVTSTSDISKLPGNSSRLQAMMEFYGGLSPQQFAEEAAKLEALPMNERLIASFLLFGRWAETDPTAAMAFSNTMGMAGGFVRPTILQSWASVDPANAAKYYAENPREFAMMDMMGGGRGGAMGGNQGAASIIASEWARQDPTAAMAWAQSLTTGKSQAMNSVLSELAKTDPRKAAEMIGQFDADSKAAAYSTVASQYGAKDFAEAQAWIRTLPAEDQAAALASAIGGLSSVDPEKAALQVASMADGEAKDRLIPDIARDLARKDPQAAADFVTSQTSQKAQEDAMNQLMPTWTNQNPVAALAFANNLPQGDVRDKAVESYVWSNNTSAPADLVKTAETITDEGDRTRAIGVAAVRWMREDQPAAKEYVASSTLLSDEAKQRITEGHGMWGGGGRGRGGNGGR